MNDEKSTKRRKTEDRRQKSVLCSLSSVLSLIMLAGCAKQQQYEAVEQISVPDMNKAEVMQIAEGVLAKMHFVIDKADYESGIIRTKPLPAAQFFELWRCDNVGAFNTAEANLHTIRRIAELRINQRGAALRVDCDVQVQRLSLPSENSKFEIRNSKFPPQAGGMSWIDLGKDTRLATEILKRISSMLDARRSSLDIENRESSIE